MISSPFRLALSHRIAARIAVNKVSRSTKTACKEAGKRRRGSRAQPARPAFTEHADRFLAGKPLGNTLRRKQTVTAGGRTLRYNNPRTCLLYTSSGSSVQMQATTPGAIKVAQSSI